MNIIEFNAMKYRKGNKGMIFRLKHEGDMDKPDDWLRTTVTEQELLDEVKLVADKEKRAIKKQLKYEAKRKAKRLAQHDT